MEQVAYALPGAIATYTAKSALFTASETDRGTFFDSTGSFTITLDTTSMSTGWSAWFRTVSGTQVLDPSGATLINGAATYSVANAGDVVLVTYTGSAFVISHSQRPSTVAISGGTIDGTPIGGTVRAAGAFTTLAANGAVTATAGTASTTTATGTIVVTGGVGISGAIYAGSIQNTPIGSTTPSSAAFTTLTANGATTLTAGTASTTTGTGTLVVTGGVGVSGAMFIGSTFSATGSATIGGDILWTQSNTKIRTTQADGSDSSFLSVCGGGDDATGRGGTIRVYGNDQGGAGAGGGIYLLPGTGTDGVVYILAGVTPGSPSSTQIFAGNGILKVGGTTASTSTTTGALIVGGGCGIAGALNTASIKFANAGSTLSNYEEGTFTPVIAGTSTPGTQTYSAQVGRYVRLGRIVYIQMDVAMSALDGTTAGSVTITGLPFTSANVTSLQAGLYPIEIVNVALTAAKVYWAMRIQPNDNKIQCEEMASAAGKSSLPVANLAATSEFRLTGFYEI